MSSTSTNDPPAKGKRSLRELGEVLKAEVLTGGALLDNLVEHVECTDQMSQVLAFTDSGNLLLTGLTNIQVVNTAHVAGLIGVVFVRGRRPGDEVISKAASFEIPLLLTPYPMYDACGILYMEGMAGKTI